MKKTKSLDGISRRGLLGAVGTTIALGGLATPTFAQSRKIKIIGNQSSNEQRETLSAIAAGFKAETGIDVELSFMDHEGHKTAIRNYLIADAPDVCFWFSGNRMKAFVDRDLFDDVSDLVVKENYAEPLGATLTSVTVDGAQFGLPLGGTLWGNFYLENMFEEKGLTVPTTWDELLAYSEKAKSLGMVPMTIGTKELWTTGGFFDQLNLRINGLEKHIALMDGKISYTDPMLIPVFDHWAELIKSGFFLPDHSSFGWQESAALLGRGEAGMINLGAFVHYGLPKEQKQFIRYAPFPKIADIPRFEDFSVDSIHVPAKAKNKELAREFLAYFYKPKNLAAYVGPGSVPPRNDIPPGDDPLVNAAVKSLQSVAGTAQYYDRDTDPDMAQAGMKGFQEFMSRPERRDDILARLEKTRARIFK